MIRLEARFLLKTPLERTWGFFADFHRFAQCIPTLKSYQLLDETKAEGKVGVKLGVLPVESRVYIEIKEKRAPECIKAEGISYLGETIVEQIRQGDAGRFDRDAVGRFQIHLDLREQTPHSLVLFEAGVEAEGRLRRIYESIIKRKLPEMKKEFLEKVMGALQCEAKELEKVEAPASSIPIEQPEDDHAVRETNHP